MTEPANPVTEAQLIVGDETLTFPIVTGSEGERALDISALRKSTGMITIDPGFVNTGACSSSITFLNGEKGFLRHRGYSIEDLAAKESFVGVAYLMIHGELPNAAELKAFESAVQGQYALEEELVTMLEHFPRNAHPMAWLTSAIISLSALYPDDKNFQDPDVIPRLLANMAVVTAVGHRLSEGKSVIPPNPELGYCENFLHMLLGDEDIETDTLTLMASVLNRLLILHADHEQNCSTSTVRIVRSADGNPYSSIAAGLGSLWGPLHGGANQAVMEMLQAIQSDGGDIEKTLARAKDKSDPFRLMGFGHRVYKTYDPRARIAKQCADEFLKTFGSGEKLIAIAVELEAAALSDEYFKSRNLYPNVDFYTGIIYRAMKFPTDMFTALFAIGRTPGWVAHAVELENDPRKRIGRPRQVYQGPGARDYVTIADR